MIYLVVPEEVGSADEFNLWAACTPVLGFGTDAEASTAARSLAKEHHVPFTVRKVSIVSYYRGRP